MNIGIVSNLGPWPCRVIEESFPSISEYKAAIFRLVVLVHHAGGVGLLVGRLPDRVRLSPIAAACTGDKEATASHVIPVISDVFEMAEMSGRSPVAAAVCAMKGLLESGDWAVPVPGKHPRKP